MQYEVPHSQFVHNRLQVKCAGLMGGPKLLLNGVIQKSVKRIFIVPDDTGNPVSIKLKYNILDRLPVVIVDGQAVTIAAPLTKAQYAWAALPGAILLFSGGGLGGLVGGFSAYSNCHIFRNTQGSELKKYLLTLLISAGAWIVYFVIILILALMFPGVFQPHAHA